MLPRFLFLLTLVVASVGSEQTLAADRDDVYAEFAAGVSLNSSGRQRYGAVVGYLPRDDIGVGVGMEQLYSTQLKTADKSAFRGLLELRWFQEPFEFAADVGIANRQYRDESSKVQASFSVTTAYLFALTPSLALKTDFSFLFIKDPRVIFSGGLGARILF